MKAPGQRGAKAAKRRRCHRYYCPFAHGNQELRSSPLSAQQREACIAAIENFPSDKCCKVCAPHFTGVANQETASGGSDAASYDGSFQQVPPPPIPPQQWTSPAAGIQGQANTQPSKDDSCFTQAADEFPQPREALSTVNDNSVMDPFTTWNVVKFIFNGDDGDDGFQPPPVVKRPPRAPLPRELRDVIYALL